MPTGSNAHFRDRPITASLKLRRWSEVDKLDRFISVIGRRHERRACRPSAHVKRTRRVALIALSPLDVEEGVQTGKKTLDDLGGLRVVSACLDRP